MSSFCIHFGALPALPRGPLDASWGQEWSKFGQRVDQKDHFWRKGAPGQNHAIYYVFVLFWLALAGIGQLEGAPGGFIGGKGPPCAGMRAQGSNWDL